MSGRRIEILKHAQAVHVRAAEEIAHFAGEAVSTLGEFPLCLAGGKTPEGAYAYLAERLRSSVDWKEVHFFWSDERCVAPTDAASNFAMAERTLLGRLRIAAHQVHRIQGELAPAEAAAAYEAELRAFFSLADGDLPRFALILLGLGENAHVASLFPSAAVLRETQRLVAAVEVDDPHPRRITLTPAVLNNARAIIFMVTGRNKAPAVKAVLEGPADADRFPGQLIAPSDGQVIWLLDQEAASLLSAESRETAR